MPKIKNVSPFGDLEVPLLGAVVEHGSIVEVSEEHARILLMQPSNFQPWGPDAREALEKEQGAEAAEPKKAGDNE
jgi:hypothetical protein